jgi:hypothetical protein
LRQPPEDQLDLGRRHELPALVEELFPDPPVGASMNDTSRKAGNNMMKFVTAILAAALVIGAGYFFFLHPGEPAGSQTPPSPHAIDQTK